MRRNRPVLAVALAWACAVVLAAPPAAAATTTARSLLAQLPVATETYGSTYDRAAFRHWTDADGDSCDTREEVLVAESTVTARTGTSCQVLSGRWVSYYDGVAWTDPSDVDIDHVVALKEAWESGARAWTGARRDRFANDLGYAATLQAITDNVNSSKQDSDPAQWLPPRAAAHCTYAIRWVAVKYRWRLSIDTAEQRRLSELLAGSCGGTTVTVPPRAS